MPTTTPCRVLLLLECLCFFFLTISTASELNSDSVPADSGTCLSQSALDIAKAEIEELNIVNTELIKLIEELKIQNDDKCQDEVKVTTSEAAVQSEESWLTERDIELSVSENSDVASPSKGDVVDHKHATPNFERVKELEAEVETKNTLLEEANTKLKAALADLQEAKEISVASRLESSACEQAVLDMKEDLEKRNSLVDNLRGQVDMALAEFKAYKGEVRQVLQDAQKSHSTHTRTCVCDLGKCQSALVPHFGLQDIAESGKHLFAEYSAHCVAIISLIYTRLESLYTLHLEQHVDALMESEHVQKFLKNVDYVEGKIHVFLYFTWKDSPRIVMKIAREIQYLGYFLHWKGTQLLQHLALLSYRGLVSYGVHGIDLRVFEYVFYAIGVKLFVIGLYCVRKQLWGVISWIFGAIWFLLLCPYWMITKPFRVLWGMLRPVPQNDGALRQQQ